MCSPAVKCCLAKSVGRRKTLRNGLHFDEDALQADHVSSLWGGVPVGKKFAVMSHRDAYPAIVALWGSRVFRCWRPDSLGIVLVRDIRFCNERVATVWPTRFSEKESVCIKQFLTFSLQSLSGLVR